MSIRGFDISAMLVELLASGVSLHEITERLGAGNFSEKLLKHYLKGGVPNVHRGNIIIGMWCAATGKTEDDAPIVDWEPAYRIAQNQTMTMRPRCIGCGQCDGCGQIIRGRALFVWQQKKLFEEGAILPSWLAPKPMQRGEFQGRRRVVRLPDDEREGTLL